MKNKILFILIFALITGGVVYSQDFKSTPKNAFVIDVGPALAASIQNSIGEAIDVNFDNFRIGAHYERELQKHFSVGLRFVYINCGFGYEDGSNVPWDDLSSFSLEGHFRYYPKGDTFFINFMLGYAYLLADFSGLIDIEDGHGSHDKKRIFYKAQRDYIKYGGKLGWRVDFGKPGGFIFEPSFGWYGGIGLGETTGDKYKREFGKNMPEYTLLWYLENWILVGGPQFSLAFGLRF